MKIGLICGGPSLERGISLNSARSVLDHLEDNDIEIIPIYFDARKKAYKISASALYSNTPSDFDFKLGKTATPLSEKALVKLLKNIDIAFPVMHGHFGEDGGIQSFLEKHNIPFVGSGSESCKKAFDKFIANEFIKEKGFFTLPSCVLKIYHDGHKKIIEKFFKEHKIKRAIVKPATGGSSIGVFSVSTPKEALAKTHHLFSKRMDTRVVLEQFAKGKEFTVIILQNRFCLPTALVPTEIETDYSKHQIFDFRKKYLPTRRVIYHCPPRFTDRTIEKIRIQAGQLFALFNMRDFARFDGWVFPNGNIWFCDFNPISGMEQNSFLFQQSSRIGMAHSDMLRHVVHQAAQRYSIPFPQKNKAWSKAKSKRKPVNILFGGVTSERQVSLMSGTNVWLKLRKSQKYAPFPFLLDTEGNVWQLPYHLTLNHTVEEITDACKKYPIAKERLENFEERSRIHLGIFEQKDSNDFFDPKKMSLKEFIEESCFVFIALHGGDGENGNLQKMLDEANVRYNGPGEKTSRLCIDKALTSQAVRKLKIEGVKSIPSKIIPINAIKNPATFWKELRKDLNAKTIVVKPRADGCSSGVVHLYSSEDLENYVSLISKKAPFIAKGTFKNQINAIEMPIETPKEALFEKFIETDVLKVKRNKLKHYEKSGWIEATIGVISDKDSMLVFNPSITIAEGEVLSVEEKFQGGTGVNITPPPSKIISPKILDKIKSRIKKTAKMLCVTGYCRIDVFVEIKTGNILVIEVNTLPGLTPSTVLYHQALAENPPIYPRQLLETLIENKKY